MYTDVMLCDGCGADVVVILHGLQARPTQVYCHGCTKLNAAKVMYAAQQQQQAQIAQQYSSRYRVGGQQNVSYQRRSPRPSGPQFPSSYTSAQAQAPQCSFTWDMPRMAYAVTCQYQPNFIEFIKAKIPVSDRAWDSTTKTWYIKDAWFDIMFELSEQLWPNAVNVVTRAQAEKAWKEQEDARAAMLLAQRQAVLGPFETALLEFCSLCDVDALRKARNAMAVALHPDKGGDANNMARLNASWYIVETELKKLTEKK